MSSNAESDIKSEVLQEHCNYVTFKNLVRLICKQSKSKNKNSFLIRGDGGIGKSQLAYAVGRALDMEVFENRPAYHDIGDYTGIPFAKAMPDGTQATSYFPPEFVNILKHKAVILFLDELNRAMQTVQNQLMELILDRRINNIAIHPDTIIIAAVNYDEGMSLVNPIAEQTLNRMYVADLQVSVPDWLEWANDVGVPSDVIGFIRENPNKLKMQYMGGKHIFATPRSWKLAADFLQQEMDEKGVTTLQSLSDEIPLFTAGFIGPSVAQEFQMFCAEKSKFFDPALVLDNWPETKSKFFETNAPNRNEMNQNTVLTLVERLSRAMEEFQLTDKQCKNLRDFLLYQDDGTFDAFVSLMTRDRSLKKNQDRSKIRMFMSNYNILQSDNKFIERRNSSIKNRQAILEKIKQAVLPTEKLVLDNQTSV